MMKWVLANGNIVDSGGYTDAQKLTAHVNPGLAWVEIVPPIKQMPDLTFGSPTDGAPPLPINRWIITGGVVTVEPIS